MFGRTVDEAAKAHALAAAPEEACGIVVDGAYLPLPNIAADRRESFRLDERVLIERAVEAIVHSHVHPSPPVLSGADEKSMKATALPWGLVHVRDGVAAGPVWHVPD